MLDELELDPLEDELSSPPVVPDELELELSPPLEEELLPPVLDEVLSSGMVVASPSVSSPAVVIGTWPLVAQLPASNLGGGVITSSSEETSPATQTPDSRSSVTSATHWPPRS